jgi:hypothetical protein
MTARRSRTATADEDRRAQGAAHFLFDSDKGE